MSPVSALDQAAHGRHEAEIAHDVPVVATVRVEDVEPGDAGSIRHSEPPQNDPAGTHRAVLVIGQRKNTVS